MRKTIEQSFWEKVEKGSGCWNWLGGKNGAGRANFRGRSAPRVCWELVNKETLSCFVYVCHACDNPACVNPDHLWLGTQKDNVHDMISKGRKVVLKKENHGMAKLRIDIIDEIRQQIDMGYSHRMLAGMYGISKTQIGRIARREQWQ